MPACDFTALPSFYDGMPNVLLESATLGIPFIAARAGGIADVIGNDENLLQLSFHPGDRHGCRKALWYAASMEDSRRKTCGRMLKKRVIEDFSADKEAQAYMQILNKSMKRSDIGFMKF
jgi:glycosyltransferase involved in cell wall biosynthesis